LGAPPDLDDEAGRELAARRVQALHYRLRNAEAVELFEELLRAEGREDPLALGRARFAARDWAGATQAFGEVLGAPDQARGAAEVLFDYALAFARQGDYATASTIYRRLMAQHP